MGPAGVTIAIPQPKVVDLDVASITAIHGSHLQVVRCIWNFSLRMRHFCKSAVLKFLKLVGPITPLASFRNLRRMVLRQVWRVSFSEFSLSALERNQPDRLLRDEAHRWRF